MDPKTITSLKLLSEGFKRDFVKVVFESEKFSELLMDLSSEFVEENIPVVDEENQLELALLLVESVKLDTY